MVLTMICSLPKSNIETLTDAQSNNNIATLYEGSLYFKTKKKHPCMKTLAGTLGALAQVLYNLI